MGKLGLRSRNSFFWKYINGIFVASSDCTKYVAEEALHLSSSLLLSKDSPGLPGHCALRQHLTINTFFYKILHSRTVMPKIKGQIITANFCVSSILAVIKHCSLQPCSGRNNLAFFTTLGVFSLHCKDTIPKIWNKYFQKKKIGHLSPNFHIYVSVSYLILPLFVCLFCYRKTRETILVIYKLLTDTWIFEIGTGAA